MAGQELLYVTSVRSQKGLGTLKDKRQKSARTLYMEAHAQEVRQGTNAEGKVMLQGGEGVRERKGERNVSYLHSDLSQQRHGGDHAGFPISMAQLVGPHSINLPHFLSGLRRAEWNIEPARRDLRC